ncbi:Clan SB, family S8, subtilisin-like serine peptidase, partial [Trichomonas vaginalis G3]
MIPEDKAEIFRQQYKIDFSTRYMIEQGLYKMKLTKTQASFLMGAKLAALYPLKSISPIDMISNTDYILKTTPDFKKDGYNIINLSNQFYIYKQSKNPQILNTTHIISSEILSKPHFHNKYTSDLLLSGVSQTSTSVPNKALNMMGLDGSGQVITITDSGVDIYHPFFYDPNISVPINTSILRHRKIVRFDSLHNLTDFKRGHGTHMAATIAGSSNSPDCSIDSFSGLAPGSKLYVVGLSDKDGNISFDGYDMNKVYQNAKKLHSYIGANSWGMTDYQSLVTEAYDLMAYNNPDFLTIFSVGNSNCYNCLSSPSDAKNILSVGATTMPSTAQIEQYLKRVYTFVSRSLDITLKFYQWSADPWKLLLESPPVKIVNSPLFMQDNPNLQKIKSNESKIIILKEPITCESFTRNATAYLIPVDQKLFCKNIPVPVFGYSMNEENDILSMKRVSLRINVIPSKKNIKPLSSNSNGPTVTGIFKPELLAPGEGVISAAAGDPFDKTIRKCNASSLIKKSGTSPAAASIAGAAAIIRQYFSDGWYPFRGKELIEGFDPTASLVKAVLIASATPIGTSLGGPTLEGGFGIPNIKEILGIDVENLDQTKKKE